MYLTVDEAREWVAAIFTRHGLTHEEGMIIADHLVEAELCGHTMAGLARVIAVCEVLDRIERRPVQVVREDATTAQIDGGYNPGYLVAYRQMQVATAKAKVSGVAAVTAHNTYYTGRNGYYVERSALAGCVAMMANSASRTVAPYGGIDKLFGTNPISFAFPTGADPIVFDMGTGLLNQGDLRLAALRGEQLRPGEAVDADGNPTVDPAAALAGAVLPFGGAKGYALCFAIQALGVLAGGDPVAESPRNWGHLFIAVDVERFLPMATFTERLGELVAAVKGSRRAPGVAEIRIPGERSARERRIRRETGFELADEVAAALKKL